MGALTLRLADDRHQRLRDEMTMRMLADFDAETRFKLYAAEGKGMTERGLQLLDIAAAQGVAA
jgi:hypothetical protein